MGSGRGGAASHLVGLMLQLVTLGTAVVLLSGVSAYVVRGPPPLYAPRSVFAFPGMPVTVIRSPMHHLQAPSELVFVALLQVSILAGVVLFGDHAWHQQDKYDRLWLQVIGLILFVICTIIFHTTWTVKFSRPR